MTGTSPLAGPRAFFATSLARALELGVATPDDLLVHATPDVLSLHLPRAEWHKLLAACLAAPRTDARLVVDTITVPVLCEHVPLPILWACLAQLAQRALGRGLVAPPPPAAVAPIVVAPPPAPAPSVAAAPPAPVAPRASTADERTVDVGRPSAPAATVAAPAAPVAAVAAAPLPAAPARAATPEPAPRARTAEPAPLGDPPAPPRPGNGTPRTTLGARRPQAAAAMPPRKADGRAAGGRAPTATDFEIETDLGDTWKKDPEQVDDDQLIDWSQNEETQTGEPVPGAKR